MLRIPSLKIKQIKKEDISAFIVLASILFIYSYIQITNFTPAYLEVDPDGYLLLAKRFAEFKSPAVKDDDPFMYQSHVWVENSKGKIAPKFAPGYPMLMAIAYRLGGDTAMFFVSPIMGGLALIGSFLLFRIWMSRASALFGVFYLAINAMILLYCNYLLTHASDLCFAVWGMFFLWRWKRGIGKYSGIFAGLFLGGAMTIRHTSALFITVLISAIIAKWIGHIKAKDKIKPMLKSTAILIACYCVLPFLMAIYNWNVFDSPFATGYDLTGEQTAFKLKNIIQNAKMLTYGLNYTALFFMFPIGLAGMFIYYSFSEIFMILLWVVPLFLLYTSYYWAPNGMSYFRFLISTFPAFVGSACAVMDKASLSWIKKTAGYILISGLIIYVTYSDVRSAVEGTVSNYPSRSLATFAKNSAKILNDNAVIFSRWPAFCYIGTRKHFRHYDLNIFTKSYGTNSFTENTEPKRQPIRNTRLREF
ncbi:MAG: ArnT family glycosyltransferase, partial [Candidatus Poribacteria bacterium]